ncbi:MAG TPA: hypothetical protein VFN67_38110 [Polyangiales bacterium]|nr:hypothetical protein [Polyangiales bacterium]
MATTGADRYRRVVWGSVLACSACTLGQPLVDEAEPEAPGQVLPCFMAPRCDDPGMTFEVPEHPALLIAGCASMKLCQLGDNLIGQGGCPGDAPLDALPQHAKCQRLKVQAQPDEDELILNELEWSEVNLELHAEKPTTLTMSGGMVESVYLALHGPIALHVERMHRVNDLRIRGEATASGAPSVNMDEFLVEMLSIGSAEADFPGSVQVHALQLSDADIRAQRVVIESASIEHARLRADTINAADLTLKLALVETSNALWSSYGVEDSFLRFCGDARLIDGSLTRVGVNACLESPLRVYASLVSSSTVDGGFELDDVSLNNSRLAKNEQTRVLAFQTHVMSSVLCEGVEEFALDPTSDLKCSDCADPQGEQALCMLKIDGVSDDERARDPLPGNYCKAWDDFSPPDCEGDLRMRPERRR